MKKPINQLMFYFIPAPLVLLAFMVLLFMQCKTVAPKEYTLRVGKTFLTVDPTVGARIVSLKYNDYELLTPEWVFPENYGSTLWTAPQSSWGWPPFDTLDCLPYSKNKVENEFFFVSDKSHQLGFQVVKTFKIGREDSSFLITYTIRNIDEVEKSVGPWEVTRVAPGGTAFFPSDPDSAVMRQSNLPCVTVSNNMVWFDYDDAKITFHSKLFAMSQGGWLAYLHNGILLLKILGDRQSTDIAPGQGEVEIYANGDNKYIELENHGDYRTLQPGDSVVYPVKWMARKVPKSLLDVNNRNKLVQWIETQL